MAGRTTGPYFFAHYVNNVNFASENVNSVSPPNRSEKAGRGTENAFRRHTLGERKSCLGERKSCRPNSALENGYRSMRLGRHKFAP